jgi:hypothetical protein
MALGKVLHWAVLYNNALRHFLMFKSWESIAELYEISVAGAQRRFQPIFDEQFVTVLKLCDALNRLAMPPHVNEYRRSPWARIIMFESLSKTNGLKDTIGASY